MNEDTQERIEGTGQQPREKKSKHRTSSVYYLIGILCFFVAGGFTLGALESPNWWLPTATWAFAGVVWLLFGWVIEKLGK